MSKFQVGYGESNEDGIPSSWTELIAPDASFRWYNRDPWIARENPAPDVSLDLYNRQLPELGLELVLRPGNYKDFTEEFMTGHIESLKKRFEMYDLKVINAGNFEPPVGSPPFLTGYYRVIWYDLVPRDPENQMPKSACEALSFTLNGHLLIYRILGPENVVVNIRKSLGEKLTMFSEFELGMK